MDRSSPAPRTYPVPAKQVSTELRVVNSRFVASAAPVSSVAEAKTFVARIRAEHPDASHNVPAYLVGYGSSTIAHCSDDGEPSGTAGRPMLAVLRGSGLGDVAVVVTRYFGGTKLGTGGLVRAYGDSVRAVLKVLPRAIRIPTHVVMIEVPYRLLELVRQAIGRHAGVVLDEEFAVDVTISARFPKAKLADFQGRLRELSSGRLEAMVVESDDATIMPLPPDWEAG